MDCLHSNQKKTPEGWKCKRCDQLVDVELKKTWTPEELRSVSAGMPKDITLEGCEYRFDGANRKGSGRQVERMERKRCSEMKEAERNGGKLREVDGLRHTMSIPPEAYFGCKKKYGDDFMQDKRVKKELKKAFGVTADRD